MKKRKGLLIFLIITLFIVSIILGIILGTSGYYETHFFENTRLNGIDVSHLNLEDATKKVSEYVGDYLLSIHTRDGEKYNIIGPDITYSYEDTGEIKRILDNQKTIDWATENRREHDYQLSLSTVYSEELLYAVLDRLPICDPENMIEPTDAYIDWDEESESYVIVPESNGNMLNLTLFHAFIRDTIDQGLTSIEIPDYLYTEASIKSDDVNLVSRLSHLQGYFNSTITYTFGPAEKVEIPPTEIAGWLNVDDNYNISVNEDRIERFVQKMADTYNTYADRRQFMSTAGDYVTIGGGDYGWVINKKAEKKQLIADLAFGGDVEREPIYSQRAKGYGNNDIGDTYIEIDYTNQHLWYYKDGELACDTDIVSGNISKNNGSPDGVFKIAYKEENATLVGEDYESAVDYFMPFAYNVGIHDAKWRSDFGGDRYKYSGSHGCINIPASIAKALYEIVDVDTPVVAYYRENVCLTAENARIANAYSYQKEIKEDTRDRR